ncbi:MAG: elongation factor P [Nitrospiraceae bacterium]|nr:elongation factor P [Nitrospiraceae bacterium]
MISTAEFRGGARLELDGEPMEILEFQHVKPGKGGAFVRTKLRKLKSGNVIDKTFRAGEKVEEPDCEEHDMQFLYHDATANEWHFMDTETFEQQFFTSQQVGNNADMLKESMMVKILLYKGQPISVTLPNFVEVEVIETDPGVRGDTASGGSKNATVETGAVVKVPLYLEAGTVILIDTRTRAYVERVR